MSAPVIPLALSISNAYLLLGERPVLVDAGVPGEETRLLGALRAHGVTPKDLSLIALTHGHTDHTGSVKAVAAGEVPIAIGALDAGLLGSGANGTLPPTGPAGALLRPLIKRMTFAGATPQFRVTEPLRLEPYGIAGVMVPVGGHTPGSCVLLLDNGDAVVGDLVRGGFANGKIRPGHPMRHYFAEDPETVRCAMEKVLAVEPSRLFTGHGGPLSAGSVRRRLDTIAPHRPKAVHRHLAGALGMGVVLLAGGEDLRQVPHRPLRECPQGHPEGLAERSQCVLHAHRHGRVNRSPDQAVAFEGA
jgi:hydroxyacylglutathione hydrolase